MTAQPVTLDGSAETLSDILDAIEGGAELDVMPLAIRGLGAPTACVLFRFSAAGHAPVRFGLETGDARLVARILRDECPGAPMLAAAQFIEWAADVADQTLETETILQGESRVWDGFPPADLVAPGGNVVAFRPRRPGA